MAGPNVRAIVELNDMTYGNHYEILVDLLRSSQPPPLPPRSAHSTPSPPLAPPVGVEDRDQTDTGWTADEQHPRQHRPQHNREVSPGSTWEGFGNFTLSASAVAYFRRGGEGRKKRRWWRRIFGGDGDTRDNGSERQRIRPSTRGSTAVGGGTLSSPRAAAAADSAASPRKVKEGQRARVHWTLTKGVASGAIVPSSLPETLLCQAFYNPAIIMIVEALLDPKGQVYGKDYEKSGRHRGRNGEKGCVQNFERSEGGNIYDDDGESKSEGVGAGPGGGDSREEQRGRGWGRGQASFLAQILPPKQFFTQATLGGHRPNFQVKLCFYPIPG